jgi:hypothetical protein
MVTKPKRPAQAASLAAQLARTAWVGKFQLVSETLSHCLRSVFVLQELLDQRFDDLTAGQPLNVEFLSRRAAPSEETTVHRP